MVGGMVQAADGELDISGKGGVAVMLSEDKAHATGEKAVAVGDGATASELNSVALGAYSAASNQWATALGTSSKAGGYASLALGVGSQTTAGAERAVAIGLNSYVGDLTEEFEKYKIVENPTVLIDDSEELAGEYVSIDGSPKSDDKPSVPKEDINIPQLNSIAIGQGTKTSGYQATAIGQGARAYGAHAIAMGLASRAILDDTIAIGSQVAASAKGAIGMGRFANSFAYDSIAIGDRTAVGAKANFGTAIGAWSRVNGKNSVALGSFSSTEGIDFETDGVAKYSGEKVKAQHGVVSVGSHAYTIKFSDNDMNIPDIKRRIVNVAGGINPNDAVNVKQLTAVAESPVYIYNGGSVSNEVYTIGTAVVPKANKNYTISNLRFAFTDGLTAGTVTDGDGNKLVKVGISDKYMQSIQAEVKKAADSSAKEAGKSAKEVKDIADALKGAGIEAGKTEDGSTGSTAVGGESSIGKDSDGSVAIGKDASVGDQSSNSTAIGNGANVKDSAKEGTAIGNGSTIGDKSSGSTAIGKDANVGAEATNSTAIGNGSKVSDGAENSTAVGTGSTVGAGATNGTAIGNDTEIGEGIDNATAIGNGAKVTGGATNSVAIGAGSVADRPNTVSVGRVVEKDGKLVEETRVITHVGNGLVAKGSTDAVNGGQLYEVAQQVGNNSQAIRDLRRDSRKGDAMNAALAALKPIAYNPAEPTQIMAGIGTYRGEQAVALGAAHYVNGRTMFNAGVAYAGSSNMMANVGVTWRVGQGEVPEDKAVEADKAAAELNSRVQSLEQTVNEQREQIEKLMALLQAK